MFSDESFEPVGFESQLSAEKSETDTNVQTEEVVCVGNAAQTTERKNIGTQTVTMQRPKPEVDYAKLAAFLKRVTPGVLDALDEMYGSNAFDDYNPEVSGESSKSVSFLTKLDAIEESIDKEKPKISAMDWSIGGGTLAVSFSVHYHETWCDHLSKIKLYALSKDDEFVNVPKAVLELNACVTSISYHPNAPSILAAGLYNGDVILWNHRDEDSIATPVQVYTHSDSISQIHWHSRTVSEVSFLVSSSRDGYLLINKMVANFTTVSVFKRFKITKEHNPAENSRPRSSGGSRERAVEAGLCVTSFDFSPKDSDFFVVGTLCGGLYKCNMEQAVPVEGDTSILDPVIDEFQKHEGGSVTCVRFSPKENLFVSSSADKEIRIYDFQQPSCLHSVSVENTVIGINWFFGNSDIFASFGAGPKIMFFNVTNFEVIPSVKLESHARSNSSCIAFNKKRDIMAIGDTKGTLEIWSIPQIFSITN